MGGKSDELGQSITTDLYGNIYTTGFFQRTVDFDPGVGITNLTAVDQFDIFIQKLDTDGNFLWAKQTGGNFADRGNSITTDVNGNVYITGYFQDVVDFDPGDGTTNLTSFGTYDSFVQKLDTNGNFLWVKQIGGTGEDFGSSITTDAAENIYTMGYFQRTVDFNPGAGTANLTSAGSFDIFIQKIDANGNFLWVKQMGGTGEDFGRSITVDADMNIYCTGAFNDTVDFDPGVGITDLTAIWLSDIFVQKLGEGSTAVLENSFSENYVVYPNPTDGKFSIEFENLQESVTVRILSLTPNSA